MRFKFGALVVCVLLYCVISACNVSARPSLRNKSVADDFRIFVSQTRGLAVNNPKGDLHMETKIKPSMDMPQDPENGDGWAAYGFYIGIMIGVPVIIGLLFFVIMFFFCCCRCCCHTCGNNVSTLNEPYSSSDKRSSRIGLCLLSLIAIAFAVVAIATGGVVSEGARGTLNTAFDTADRAVVMVNQANDTMYSLNPKVNSAIDKWSAISTQAQLLLDPLNNISSSLSNLESKLKNLNETVSNSTSRTQQAKDILQSLADFSETSGGDTYKFSGVPNAAAIPNLSAASSSKINSAITLVNAVGIAVSATKSGLQTTLNQITSNVDSIRSQVSSDIDANVDTVGKFLGNITEFLDSTANGTFGQDVKKYFLMAENIRISIFTIFFAFSIIGCFFAIIGVLRTSSCCSKCMAATCFLLVLPYMIFFGLSIGGGRAISDGCGIYPHYLQTANFTGNSNDLQKVYLMLECPTNTSLLDLFGAEFPIASVEQEILTEINNFHQVEDTTRQQIQTNIDTAQAILNQIILPTVSDFNFSSNITTLRKATGNITDTINSPEFQAAVSNSKRNELLQNVTTLNSTIDYLETTAWAASNASVAATQSKTDADTQVANMTVQADVLVASVATAIDSLGMVVVDAFDVLTNISSCSWVAEAHTKVRYNLCDRFAKYSVVTGIFSGLLALTLFIGFFVALIAAKRFLETMILGAPQEMK